MLIFNPATKNQINLLLADLPQGILLTGPAGAGLLTTAKHIAGSNIAAIIEPTNKDSEVDHQKGTISVVRIRELYEQSRSKTNSLQIFIIDDADKMSAPAQNAFLKLLEEPNKQVVFILTSHNPGALLQTVVSRVEQLRILPINAQQSEQILLGYKLAASKQAQALFVAAGKPAELSRLAADNTYFETKASIMAAAKQFISGNKASRLEVAFNYASDREKALQLLRAGIAIVSFALKNKPTASAVQQCSRLANAYDAIAANGNAKLHLVATVI